MVERKEVVERAVNTVLRMLREGDQHAADAILKLLETLAEETEAADNWRRLALQFDNHRMQALGHLKAVVNPGAVFDAYKAAKAFLNAPPLDGEEVLAQRIAELAAAQAADAGNPVSASATVSDAQIKAVFLANGFKIKEGMTDLKPYVYQAARAILVTAGQAQSATPKLRPEAWLATFRPKGMLSSHSVAGTNLEELKRSVPSDSKFKPLYAQPILTIVGMSTTVQTEQGGTQQ